MLGTSTTVSNTTNAITAVFNTAGHYADLLFSTLSMTDDATTNTGNRTSTFTFDSGTLVSTTTKIGSRLTNAGNHLSTATLFIGETAIGTSSNLTNSATLGTVTMATQNLTTNTARGNLNIGGTATTVGITTLTVANNTAANGGTATGVVTIDGGSTTLTNGITLAAQTTSGSTVNGTITLNGGTLKLGTAGITTTVAGTGATSTINLQGGTLNMNSKAIGGVGQLISNLNFKSGTLQNVLQINNGAGLTKITDGTGGGGTLTLSGVNSFTGGVTISAGTVQIGSAGALNATAGSENAVDFGAATSGTLQLNGNTVVIANLTGSDPGTIVENANATNATLTIGNSTSADGTYAGTIQNGTGGGTLFLAKGGAGTLTLSGNNTFGSGTLAFGSSALNRGAIRLASANALGNYTAINMPANNTGVSRIELTGGFNFNAYNITTAGRSNALTTGAVLVNISGNNTWQGSIAITSTGGSYGIVSNAGTLTLSGEIRNDNTANVRTWDFGGAGDIVVSGAIKEGPSALALSIRKNDAGTMTVSNSTNSYSGSTFVSQGTLKFGASNVIPDTSAVTVGANTTAGTLDIAGFSETLGDSTATARLIFGTTTTTVGGLQSQVINSGGSAVLTVEGGITYNAGASGFENGKATISANISSGTLGIDRSWIINDSPATSVDLEISGVVSGSNNITKTQGGTLFLNNGANTNSGFFYINQGTVQVTKLDDTGNNSSLGTGSGGNSNIRLGNQTTSGTLEYLGSGDSSTNRRIQLGNSSVVVGEVGSGTILNSSGTGKLTFSNSTFNVAVNAPADRTLTLGGSNTMDNTISGAIVDNSGAGATVSLIKQDAGKWILTGSNTYTGTTTVSAGTLKLAGSGTTIATDANTATSSDILINGGTLEIAANEQIANTGSIMLTSGFLNFGSASGLTETIDKLTVSGTGTFVTGANTLIGLGATITWSGGTNTVSAGGSLQDGHIVISGGTNTVQGGATGGVLQVNSGGAGLEMSSGATLTLNSDNAVAGKLKLNGNVSVTDSTTATIASGLANTNAGNVDLNGGNRSFTVASGGTLNVGAQIIDGTGTGSVTKEGAGKMTVSSSSGYTGTTTVNGGILEVTGTLSGTTAVTVNTGGTLLLNNGVNDVVGNGVAGLAVAGGKVAVGSGVAAPTTQTYASLSLSGASVLDFGVNGQVNTTGSQLLINNTGAVSFTGTLAIWNWGNTTYSAGVDGGSSGDGNARLLFVQTTGWTTELGNITFYSDNGITPIGPGGAMEISFGGQFEIVPVPEPATTALIGAVALCGLIGYRERRRFRGAARNSRN